MFESLSLNIPLTMYLILCFEVLYCLYEASQKCSTSDSGQYNENCPRYIAKKRKKEKRERKIAGSYIKYYVREDNED